MNEHVSDRLPFYFSKTLGESDRAAVEAHLKLCAACTVELAQWQALSEVVRLEASSRISNLPPLATWITRAKPAGPTFADAEVYQPDVYTQGVAEPMSENIDSRPHLAGRPARLRRPLAIVAGLVLILGLALLTLFLLNPTNTQPNNPSNSATQAAALATPAPTQPASPPLAAYPGAVELTYDSEAFKARVMDNLSQEQRKAGYVGLYATNDDVSNVAEYYKQQLTGAGYTILNQGSLDPTNPTNGSILYAAKGDSVVICQVINRQVRLNAAQNPADSAFTDLVENQLKPNQNLIAFLTYTGTIYQFDNMPTPTAKP